jgi:uncharacterized coiled-coil protein SlyX
MQSTIRLNKKMKPKKTTSLTVRNSIRRSPMTRSFLLIALALAWFALSPLALAVTPAPDGGYPGNNTAEGTNALNSLTTGGNNTATGFFALQADTTGNANTATGFEALFNNTMGKFNTANGANALLSNTTGNNNTAEGTNALLFNTTGGDNTANGFEALFSNTTGTDNTANGSGALFNNTTGGENMANGSGALFSNTSGIQNTADGVDALETNVIGNYNTANGFAALALNFTGNNNTAIGARALNSNTNGSNNIALGESAGLSLTTGDYNIDIGTDGVAGESNTIRIGDDNHQGATFIGGIYGRSVSGLAVAIDATDHLGTVSSSRRFKRDIRPMNKASEALLALKPVTFHYKKEIDAAGTSQFGLVAEEVEKVNPDLVVRDKEGKPYSVRYEAVNAMLLNEFLKEHRKVEEQQATIVELKAADTKHETIIAKQQKQIETLTANLQKVSDQVEASRPSPQMVLNNQ